MFYIEDKGKIVLFDEDEERLEKTLNFMPEFQGLEIKKTERPIENFQFADTEEYLQEQAQKERERLHMLSLTAADVERAIYKAKGMDFEDVIEMVSKLQTRDSQLTNHEIDLKALKIELKANNFYRGNPYIEQVGALLGFTPAMLDEFFETGDYTKLVVPEEEESESRDSQSVNRDSQDIDIDQSQTNITEDDNNTTTHDSRLTIHETNTNVESEGE